MGGGMAAGRLGRRVAIALLGLLALLGLAACTQEGATPPEPTAAARLAPTQVIIPTLYPTATSDRQAATATPGMPATRAPEATADLQQTVVSLHYQIPALGLDRRLEGNVAGTVTVVDETAGLAATVAHQGGVLYELQTALPQLALAELPAGCDGCVAFSYSLPLSGEAESGWLQDAVMLASVENYLALTLGPHWPEGTVAGLRRSASPYHVAQTAAVTAEGDVYRWRATAAEVGAAETGAPPPLPAEPESLALEFAVTCPGAPLETLYINAAGHGAAEGRSVAVTCPAFALPATLLPLYTALDELLAPLLAEEDLAAPPSEIPLNSMVVYERAGSGRLLLLDDDQALAYDAAGEVVTTTLASGTAISLTTALAESGALRAGVAAYTAAESDHILLVRTEAGMMEAAWDESPPAALAAIVEELEAIWEEALPALAPAVTPVGTPGATASPQPAATP
jgi:hypothetical protein